MQVRWSETHRVAVIDAQGDLGIRTMVEMKNAIGSLVRDGCRTLIVDCQGVQRMEAMSLGVLLERLCRVRELNGILALAGLNADLEARLLELRVHSLFRVYSSASAALQELVGAGSEAVAALAA